MHSTLTESQLSNRRLDAWPAAVFETPHLSCLMMDGNALATIPALIGLLSSLTMLSLCDNQIAVLPREIGQLQALQWLSLRNNHIAALPPEVGALQRLECIDVRFNRLAWLPLELGLVNARMYVVDGNSLVLPEVEPDAFGPYLGDDDEERVRLHLALPSEHIGTIRHGAMQICMALQTLELPALVTLEILDAAFPNTVRMATKWDLIVAVKHFFD